MNRTYVIDASVAVGWSTSSRYSKACARVLREADALIAPDLIFPEVANAFYQQIKTGVANEERLREGLDLLPRWFSEIVPSATLRKQAFELSLQLQHPAYDCFYLGLALLRETKFVTSDAHFHRKAVAAGYQDSMSLLDEWTEG